MVALALRAWGGLKFYLAMAGAVLLAVAYVYIKGRREGAQGVRAEVQKETEKVRRHWDEIDARRPDFDGAVGSLRNRSRRR